VLLLLAAVNLLGVPSTVLLPIIAGDVLHGGAHTLGFLTAAIGVGALCGALYMASRRSVLGLGRLILAAVSVFSVSLMVLALCRTEWLAVPVLMATGLGMMIHMASSNTLVQTLVDPGKRGRVMSFYAVAFMGTYPLGSLLVGAVASRIGAPWTVCLSGLASLAAALLYARALPALRAEVWPIYRQMGVLTPEAARVAPAGEGVKSRRT
jgi:MFS family permease